MSNSYVWLLTESSSKTLIQRNACELASAHLTWQGNVRSLSSWQFGLVIVINPPSLVGEELITLSGWGNWKTSCVKIVFAWINGEDDIISVCLSSVLFFSGEISQNIWPQKYKGSLYSVSWKIYTNFVRFFFFGWEFLLHFNTLFSCGAVFHWFAKSKSLALCFPL